MLEKPWLKDPIINEVLETIVSGQNSICQRIRNSPNLQSIFQDSIQAMACNRTIPDSAKRLKHLGFALHRFDSLLRPLTRFVLLLEAIMRALLRNVRLPP